MLVLHFLFTLPMRPARAPRAATGWAEATTRVTNRQPQLFFTSIPRTASRLDFEDVTLISLLSKLCLATFKAPSYCCRTRVLRRS